MEIVNAFKDNTMTQDYISSKLFFNGESEAKELIVTGLALQEMLENVLQGEEKRDWCLMQSHVKQHHKTRCLMLLTLNESES